MPKTWARRRERAIELIEGKTGKRKDPVGWSLMIFFIIDTFWVIKCTQNMANNTIRKITTL